MSLDRIRERIINKAKDSASKLLEEERQRLQKEKENFLNIKKVEFEEKEKRTREELEFEFKTKFNLEKMNFERMLLEEKRKIIDELFLKIEQDFLQMDEKEYLNFLKKIIKRDAPSGTSVVYLNNADRRRFGKAVDDFLKKELEDRHCTLSKETVDIKGGCIIKGEDVQFDNSLDSLIRDLRDNYEIEISKRFFEDF